MPTLAPRARIPEGPSKRVYDVIVLGGQLGGAVAAALLAKRGYRVLHIEHDGMGHGYQHDGWLLPYAPFVLPQLRMMPKVEEALVELGLNTEAQRALKPHAHGLQVVMPDHRFDLEVEDPRRLAELTRELGPDASAFNAQYAQALQQHEASDAFFRAQLALPPEGFFESWGVKKEVARHPGLTAESAIPASGAGALVRSFAPFLHYLAEPTQPLPLTRTLSQVLRGPQRFPGGREGLRELLVKKLQSLGGDFFGRDSADSYVVEELSFDGGTLEGLKLVGSDNIYRAPNVIAALDSPALRRLVPDKKKHRSLVEMLDLSTTKKFLFTVNWVVEADALPRGMGDLVLLETPGDDLGPILIQLHGARKPEAKADDESQRVVCAAAFVPGSARELGEEHLNQLADRISAQLENLMPFAKQRRSLVSAPYLHAGGVRGSRLLPHPLYSFESESFLGISGLSQRSPVKNLTLASREVLPGLGLEGEFLAGTRAASLVQEAFKKRDPLKR